MTPDELQRRSLQRLNEDIERRVAESRRRSLARLDNTEASANAHWACVAGTVRNYMGDVWNEFVECCALANERPEDPFMLRYIDETQRPAFLAQVRRLLAEHMAVMGKQGF